MHKQRRRTHVAIGTPPWAEHLARRVQAIVRRHPEVDPDNIRLTLIALEWTPEQRLQRSLRRGRGFAAFQS